MRGDAPSLAYRASPLALMLLLLQQAIVLVAVGSPFLFTPPVVKHAAEAVVDRHP